MNRKTAIVEDEDILREEIAFQLRHFGFAVEAFASAPELYNDMSVNKYDALVLDIGLDGENGLEICRHIRQADSDIGIVFVTARAMREDRLLGLESGADAYLVKPIDIDELVLLLRRLSRRLSHTDKVVAGPPSHVPPSRWGVSMETLSLRAPTGQQIKLTSQEALLLWCLHKDPGPIKSHDELLAGIGATSSETDKHKLEVVVSRLRNKTHRISGERLPIESVRGIGYRLQSTG